MRRRGMTRKNARAAINRIVAETQAEVDAKRPEQEPLRLYYLKPNSRQTVGRIRVASSAPRKEWQLVVPMTISQKWTDDEVRSFIYDRVVELRILKGPIV